MTSTPVTAAEYPDFKKQSSALCTDVKCVFYSVANVIIFILRIAGNSLVIWIAGFKMKKSVIATWYLSLAVSDFIMCSTLPFGVVQRVTDEWIFGHSMCKFRYFIKLLSMYSRIFLLVIISVDHCVVVMFVSYVGSEQAHQSRGIMASTPVTAAEYLDFKNQSSALCTDVKRVFYSVANVIIFILGITGNSLVIWIAGFKMKKTVTATWYLSLAMSDFIMCLTLIAAFLICWLPFHLYCFLKIHYKGFDFVEMLKVFGVILANANSCLNPFLYAFMGRDFKKQCYAVLSNIENAIEEEEESREGV
ncbi:hypothetical protein MHYP_G00260570 [Metynnis hypsauchen]